MDWIMETKNPPYWKNCSLKVNAVDDETGHFSGYANTWNVDLGNDQFHPGAFKKSIKEQKGKFPIFKCHNDELEWALSLAMSEDDVGLRFDDAVAYIDDKNPKNELQLARDEYTLMKRRMQYGRPLGISIGCMIPEGKYEWNDERGGYDIYEAIIMEFSTTALPMNTQSMVSAVKDMKHIFQLPATVTKIASECNGPLCQANRKAVESTIKTLQSLLAKDAQPLQEEPAAGKVEADNIVSDPAIVQSMTVTLAELEAMRNKATASNH